MFKNLLQNLSKGQKIGIAVFLEIIFVLILVGCVRWAMMPESHVDVVDENETTIPDDNWRGIKNELWYLIQNNVADVTKANIDDATIRDGSYEEITENDITTATFLLDIDSLKQTYFITVSWSDVVELHDYLSIDCPSQSEMKYPETVCYGMYNNTYSMDLYLPYAEYPEGADEDDAEPMAPNFIIHGDEDEKTIDIMVSACDEDGFKKKAMDYLETVPIDFSDYTINIEVNNINVEC